MITRRSFLMLSGATLVASRLSFGDVSGAPPALVARALRAAPVYRRPRLESQVSGYIWPDSAAEICGYDREWFAVPGGYVQHAHMQPVEPFDPAGVVPVDGLPAWATVAAPVAPLRRWAGAEAPLVTRVGYGGVLCVLDTVIDAAGYTWYGMGTSSADDILGWTPAVRWNAVAPEDVEPQHVGRRLRLDSSTAELIALEDEREMLRAPVAVPQSALARTMTLSHRFPGMTADDHYGACWALHFGDSALYGAYWHNRFGRQVDATGWEVAPWTARWLFSWLPSRAEIAIT